MALRTCPMCQTTAEPKADGDSELCPKCDQPLPAGDTKSPDPPERPRPKTATARRETEWTRKPRRPEEPADSKKIGGFRLSVLLLVVAFVLLALFYAAVILVKTRATTPTTQPFGAPMRGNGPPNNPWGGPPPEPK